MNSRRLGRLAGGLSCGMLAAWASFPAASAPAGGAVAVAAAPAQSGDLDVKALRSQDGRGAALTPSANTFAAEPVTTRGPAGRPAAKTGDGDLGGLPEPASWLLMMIGVGMIGAALRGFVVTNRHLARLQPDQFD
jgi:hypothetical protein